MQIKKFHPFTIAFSIDQMACVYFLCELWNAFGIPFDHHTHSRRRWNAYIYISFSDSVSHDIRLWYKSLIIIYLIVWYFTRLRNNKTYIYIYISIYRIHRRDEETRMRAKNDDDGNRMIWKYSIGFMIWSRYFSGTLEGHSNWFIFCTPVGTMYSLGFQFAINFVQR